MANMTNSHAYETALKGAAYFSYPDSGYLRLSGADRVDFLQRQTTNDLHQLTEERTVSTVLTSPTARILDVFCVIDEGDTLGVITLPGRYRETSKFLRSRIFFSDNVSVNDVSADFIQILLLGPQAGEILKSWNLHPQKMEHLVIGEISQQFVKVISRKILAETGYHLLVPAASAKSVLAALNAAKITPLDSEIFNILRVETGQPGPGGELLDTYTPLEVGLGAMISDSKGCYTGQEIIARQITYDKVAKKLVGIKLRKFVREGAKIEVNGKSVGTLTSVVKSPRFEVIGLAVVRRQHSLAGTSVDVVGDDGSRIGGIVSDFPFE